MNPTRGPTRCWAVLLHGYPIEIGPTRTRAIAEFEARKHAKWADLRRTYPTLCCKRVVITVEEDVT